MKGKLSRPIWKATFALAVLLLMGTTVDCGSSGSHSTNTNVSQTTTLRSIRVTSTGQSIPVNGSAQFTATGSYSDGSSKDLTTLATWSSSSANVASISAGVVIGLTSGTTTISASMSGMTGSQTLTVTPILSSITVTPATPSVTVNTTQQFAALGTWSDGSEQDVTNQVTWASSDSSLVSITSTGLATTSAAGTVTITATEGTVSGTTALTVTAPTLNSIALTPDQPTVPLGITQTFVATGMFSDGTSQQLANVSWASSDNSVATIDNTGLGTGVATGSTTISATSGSVTGSTTLTVLPAALVSITLSPANPLLALGTTTQITATGLFTDGSTQVLSVTWASSDTTIATVDNNGVVSTVATGSVTITATVGSISAAASTTVTPAVISSIVVTPANPSVPVGSTQQFIAIGSFSDGSSQDISDSATWSSSDGSIATIDNSGSATTVAAGSSTITASMGMVSGSTTLQVTAATLQSVSVAPSSLQMATGTTSQLTAIASYSDGSTQDVTSTATWLSSIGGVASVSSSGLVTARKAGLTNITATFNGMSGSSSISVANRVLQSIVVTPANSSIAAGQKVQFTATAYYADGTSQDVTVTVHWSTSSANLATINSGETGGGLATAKATGSVTITASLSGISGSTTLSIN